MSRSDAEEALNVALEVVESKRVEEQFTLTGSVTAHRQSALSPQISGLVTAVEVDAGDGVSAGDILLRMDSVLADIAVQQSTAALDSARVSLSETERRYREAQQLLTRDSIAATEVESRDAERRMAEARVAQLEAELKQRKEELVRHVLKAPYDGIISRKLAESGEWVQTGGPVLHLVELDRLRVDIQVPQERFAAINYETRVVIHLDALPGVEIAGRVVATVPVSDSRNRTLLVRVEAEESGALMAPGLSARVVFALPSERPLLVVSRDAIVRRPDGTLNVWVAEGNGEGRYQAVLRRVDVGRTYSGMVEILAGLKEGERVVVRGNESLTPGQLMRAQVEAEGAL